MTKLSALILFKKLLHHNLIEGQTNSGQLGDWLLKETFFICMQSKKLNSEINLKYKMICQNINLFYDSLYGLCVKGLYLFYISEIRDLMQYNSFNYQHRMLW